MEKYKKLIIFGSRTLTDKSIYKIIRDYIEKNDISEIVTSGGIKGVCEVAIKVCKDIGMPLKLYFADKKYAAGMYEKRSKEIIEYGDIALLIYDGVSKGTLNELELLKKAKKKYHYIKIEDIEINVNNEIEKILIDVRHE